MNLFIKHAVTPLALAITLTLTGCTLTPEYEKPMVNMADAYLHTQSQQQINNEYWWYQFNDQALNSLVQDAQASNVTLKLASNRIRMANSYQRVVESFKVPTVNIGAGYFNYQLSENSSLLGPALKPLGETIPTGGATDSLTLLDNQHDGVFVGATASWELDLFGRIDRQTNAAKIRVEQAEIYRNGLNTIITADLVHNYLQLRGAQQRKVLALQNIEDQRKTLELVKKVVKSGYGSELDSAQAEAMLAATESLIPQLEIAEQAHKHRIAILIGEPLSQVNTRLAQDSELPNLQAIIPVGLPSDLLKRRPDIHIAEREMAAINEELGASIVNRYPKFFLTGTPGVSASSFDDLFSSDSFGWAASAGVSWNVFDGGRGKARVDMNEARFESAALSYQHTVDSAIAEVDSALFAYGRSQQSQKRIEQALTATNRAVDKAKSLYKAGLIDHLSVLDAQRQQRMMQDRSVVAKLQTAQVTVSLYKSLGGDWNLEQEQDETVEPKLEEVLLKEPLAEQKLASL
ncbi:MAG: efflux transporter outer membrane subunit [Psychromonas sp.]